MRQLAIALTALGLFSAAACSKAAETPVPAASETQAAPPEAPSDAAALGLPTDADSIADGRMIAEMQCSRCHGLDDYDALRADAPALRHVLANYPPEALADNFRAGIHVGHEDMPDFEFGDLGMDMLLSYLVSIQEVPPAAE